MPDQFAPRRKLMAGAEHPRSGVCGAWSPTGFVPVHAACTPKIGKASSGSGSIWRLGRTGGGMRTARKGVGISLAFALIVRALARVA